MSPTSPMPEPTGRWAVAIGSGSTAFLASTAVALALQAKGFVPLTFFLSLTGPAVTAILFVILLAAMPSLAGEGDDPTPCATLALVFTTLHLCVHTAVTGNPVGPFDRLVILPGDPWQGGTPWVLSMVGVTAANLFAHRSRHRHKRQ